MQGNTIEAIYSVPSLLFRISRIAILGFDLEFFARKLEQSPEDFVPRHDPRARHKSSGESIT